MILLIGKDKHLAYSLSIQFGISSGPHALEGFNAVNNFKIRISETSGSSGVYSSMRSLFSGWGRRYSSRGSRKASLIAFASFLVSKSFNSFDMNVTRNVPRVWVETAQAFDLLPPNFLQSLFHETTHRPIILRRTWVWLQDHLKKSANDPLLAVLELKKSTLPGFIREVACNYLPTVMLYTGRQITL